MRIASYAASLLAVVAIAGCGSGAKPNDDVVTTTSETGSNGGGPTAKAAASKGVKLVKVGDFDTPVYATSPPGDKRRLFVVEQKGRVMIVRGGKQQSTPFLDIRDQVTEGGEQGLLSIAFPPDYAKSGLFYVYFTDKQQKERIVEFKRSTDDTADPASARPVLVMDDPEPNHNGGLMLFGDDGHLYVGTGDGGGGGDNHGPRGNAQDLGSYLGKILRIDPKQSGGKAYTVPSDNPFVNQSGAKPEIYAYGLRNPWRYSFDRKTHDLIIGDVGQDKYEEIDFVRRGKGKGANFGWRPFEGFHVYKDGESAPGALKPVFERAHDKGWCSVTGGVVVRDKKVPGLYGKYIFGDFCEGVIWSANPGLPRLKDVKKTQLKVGGLASFGEDASGRVYAISNGGQVFRFAATK